MKPKIHDVHVAATERLIAPRALKEELPLTEELAQWVAASRQTICRIISGEDRRLMCIVGPCSIHDPDAAVDYAQRLARLAPRVADRILVVMRVYFEKPRTTTGWKGLINDPHMDDSCDMQQGLRIARRLLIEINSMGLPAATEVLDPITPQYIADLISWAAIGARTTESQTHREMASGLSMPVGFQEPHRRRLENRGQRDRIRARTPFFHRHRPGRPDRDHPHHRQSSYPRGIARRDHTQL